MIKNYSKYVMKDRVSVYPFGLKFDFCSSEFFNIAKYNKNHLSDVVRRNRILTFSKTARKRMRDFMLTYYVPSMIRCGVTLTLPWKNQTVDNVDKSVDYLREFSDVVHRFRVSWLREFPLSGCVYRVELQQRKVPHLHLIAFHSAADLPFLRDRYFLLWLSAVKNLYGGSLNGFSKYGVDVDTDLSSVRALQYLSDHSSKSKQAQLGYKGKQWGIWGRDNFIRLRGSVFHFESYDQFNFFRRHVFRYRRFKIENLPCVFGSKKSTVVPVVQSVQFISKKTLKRLFRLSQFYESQNLFLRLFWHYTVTVSNAAIARQWGDYVESSCMKKN